MTPEDRKILLEKIMDRFRFRKQYGDTYESIFSFRNHINRSFIDEAPNPCPILRELIYKQEWHIKKHFESDRKFIDELEKEFGLV